MGRGQLQLQVCVGLFGGYALNTSQTRSAADIRQARELLRVVDLARAAEVDYKIQIQEFKNVLLRGHDQRDYDGYSLLLTSMRRELPIEQRRRFAPGQSIDFGSVFLARCAP